MCVCLCLKRLEMYECMPQVCAFVRPEGVRSPGARVTGGCKPLTWVLRQN